MSHIQGIPRENLRKFLPPCLGTGPIGGTIGTLKVERDDVMWMLFCEELSRYVTVESIKGTPWRHLENVGGDMHSYTYNSYIGAGDYSQFILKFSRGTLRDFIKYYLHNGHLSIGYRDDKFVCNMPYYDYILDISNSFIDFYNGNPELACVRTKYLFPAVLQTVIARDGRFYTEHHSGKSIDYRGYIGRQVLIFKGREVTLSITDSAAEDAKPEYTTILSHDIAMYILNSILRTINFRYSNDYNRYDNGTEKPSEACGKVLYV